jgi:hypothetical protein
MSDDDDNIPSPWTTSPAVASKTKKRKPESAPEKTKKKKQKKEVVPVTEWKLMTGPPPSLPDDEVPGGGGGGGAEEQKQPQDVPPPPPQPCSLIDDDWDWQADERKDREREAEWKAHHDAAIEQGQVPDGEEHPALLAVGIHQRVRSDDIKRDNDENEEQWLPLKCFFCEYGIQEQHSDEVGRLHEKFLTDVENAEEQVVCNSVSKHIHKEYGRFERFQTPPWMVKRHFMRHATCERYIDILINKINNAVIDKTQSVLGVRMEPTKPPEVNVPVFNNWLRFLDKRNAIVRTRTMAGRTTTGGGGGAAQFK